MARFIDGSIQILPLAFDTDISFIQAPTRAHRTLALPKRFIERRLVFKHPAIETGMVDLHTALLHHFFQLPIADGIRYLLTHTPKDDVPLKRAALEIHDGCFAL